MQENMAAEELNGGRQQNLKQKAEELRLKAAEMEAQVNQNLNNLMSSTAENLDKAADKMRETANFFRERNVDTLKQDFSSIVKKKPAQTLGGALLVGFLIGKILFR